MTGHLLPSQVACLNHLYFLRQRQDVAISILRNVCPSIKKAEIVDDGYVEFEVIGKQNYLGERSHNRGAHATSIDVVMVGKKQDGMNILVMIEWKYTEDYRTENKYIPDRSKVYDPLLAKPDCPIQPPSSKNLYYEPFYQLMRQTLLGWMMVQSREYNCDEYIHLRVIPSKNKELKERVTSPDLVGETMSAAWQNVLRDPFTVSSAFTRRVSIAHRRCPDTSSIFSYLNRRYWENAYDKATLEDFFE